MPFEAVARAVSAACLPPHTRLTLLPNPDSTEPIESISYETDYSPEGNGELVCHARGDWPDLDSAGFALNNAARRNMQIFAVAANAVIHAPHLESVYEPRPGGRFRASGTLGMEPQVARRTLDLDRSWRLLQAFDRHPKEIRLLRAAENYGEALRLIRPGSSMQAALQLWVAVESLTEVVLDRVKRALGSADLSVIAAHLEVPARKDGRVDVRDVRGEIRRRQIFDEDEVTYRALRKASDGVEHGFMSFGDARDLVDGVFDQAAQVVRQSILRESGLDQIDVDALIGGIYTRPLPLWRPRVVAEGCFDEASAFAFVEDWPRIQFAGGIQTHSIEPDAHVTDASVDVQVTSNEGLGLKVGRISLSTPGRVAGFGHQDPIDREESS